MPLKLSQPYSVFVAVVATAVIVVAAAVVAAAAATADAIVTALRPVHLYI